jgi:hypothetical protein
LEHPDPDTAYDTPLQSLWDPEIHIEVFLQLLAYLPDSMPHLLILFSAATLLPAPVVF